MVLLHWYVCFLYAFSCMLSPIVIVFCLRGGWGKRGDLTWHPAVKHQRPAAKTTNSNCCDRAAAQVKQHSSTYWPEQPGWKTASSRSTEQISKKGIKLILKTIGNRKGDCAWSCSRWQTQPGEICKLQSTNQYNVRSEWHWFVRCDLQIFSGCVCHLEQLHAQSPFLFPIVFSINLHLHESEILFFKNYKFAKESSWHAARCVWPQFHAIEARSKTRSSNSFTGWWHRVHSKK